MYRYAHICSLVTALKDSTMRHILATQRNTEFVLRLKLAEQ